MFTNFQLCFHGVRNAYKFAAYRESHSTSPNLPDITIACCNLVRYCAYQAREAKYLPGFRQQAALYDSAHMEPLITPARCH